MAKSGEFQAPLGGNGNPHPPLSLPRSTVFLFHGEVRPTIVLSIADVEDWPIFNGSGWQQRWYWRPLPGLQPQNKDAARWADGIVCRMEERVRSVSCRRR
jgi:hypothetical protein